MWTEFVEAYSLTNNIKDDFPVKHETKVNSIYNRFILYFGQPLISVDANNLVEIRGNFYFRVYLTPIFDDLILNPETVLQGLNLGDMTNDSVIRETVINIIHASFFQNITYIPLKEYIASYLIGISPGSITANMRSLYVTVMTY